jgi:hypothetical protein
LAPEQVSEALNAVRASASTEGLLPGLIAVYLKACLLAALTLFISTFATTTIFSTMVMAFVYLIGHLQSTVRAYWLETNTTGWVPRGFLAAITLFFPDLQAFNLADDVIAGAVIPISLFTRTILLACFYTSFYLVLAWSVFSQKEL